MYFILLHLHSGLRWLLLIGFLYLLFRSFYALIRQLHFTKTDMILVRITSILAHIQLTTGIILYFISPIVNYFLHNTAAAMQQKEFRFFGIEHSIGMLAAIGLITYGSIMTKKRKKDKERFRTLAISYSIALVIILIAMPYR